MVAKRSMRLVPTASARTFSHPALHTAPSVFCTLAGSPQQDGQILTECALRSCWG